MKITGLDIHKISYPRPFPMADARLAIPSRDTLICQVHTDEGLSGVGEVAFFGGPFVTSETLIREELFPLIVSEDPFYIEKLWEKMYLNTKAHGRRGMILACMGGLDIALWDIVGQAVKKPLYQMVGAFRDEVWAYASCGFYADGKGVKGLQEELTQAREMGFTAYKMKVGRNRQMFYDELAMVRAGDIEVVTLEEDLARVAGAREAIGPEAKLAVDVNNAWSVNTAITMGREMEAYDIFWLEEPVSTDDYAGSAEVAAALEVPVAGYETEFSRYAFRDLIAMRAVDIVQVDSIWTGGFTEVRKIAAMASCYRLPILPHCFSSAIAATANLHLICSIPNGGMLEYDMTGNPCLTDLLVEPMRPDKEGKIRPPQKPGLGIEIDWDFVDKYRVK